MEHQTDITLQLLHALYVTAAFRHGANVVFDLISCNVAWIGTQTHVSEEPNRPILKGQTKCCKEPPYVQPCQSDFNTESCMMAPTAHILTFTTTHNSSRSQICASIENGADGKLKSMR